METSQLRHRRQSSSGFTVVETLFAILILTIGLVSLSSLAATSLNSTERSRYMSAASNLASEKLEDLNRWPSSDCNVSVPSATTYGSLTSDSSQTVSCGASTTVYYYDDVDITDNNGAINTTQSVNSGGTLTYTTTSHTPDGILASDGTMLTSTPTSAAAAGTNAIDFHRRWTIEMDQPITGVRRITVLVTLVNGYMKPPVSYQMTMVRP